MPEYTIIERDSQDYLIKEINAHLQDGWKLQGGVCVYVPEDDEHEWYCQAMWIEDKKPDVNTCPGCCDECADKE